MTATLDAFDAVGLGHDGTARSAVEQAQPQLYQLERAGQTITVAHIAAAYGTNGMPVDADKPWSVNLIDVPAMAAQAAAARAAGADLVIASVHCCVEYQTAPTAEQVAFDQAIADTGQFDLLIGHHAHVPQPVVHLTGGPRGEGMWVAYGLGNYLSNQDGACCVDEHRLRAAAHRARDEHRARSPRAGHAGRARRGSPGSSGRRSPSTGWAGTRCTPSSDIPGGTGTLSPAVVADRLARVTAAAGRPGAAADHARRRRPAPPRSSCPRTARLTLRLETSPGSPAGAPYSQPWPYRQPLRCRNSACSSCSMPSAIVTIASSRAERPERARAPCPRSGPRGCPT